MESARGEVSGTGQRKRSQPHTQTVIGQSKVEEITLEAQRLGANLIVFNQDISATQARNLEEQIGLQVDRTEVILDKESVFDSWGIRPMQGYRDTETL